MVRTTNGFCESKLVVCVCVTSIFFGFIFRPVLLRTCLRRYNDYLLWGFVHIDSNI